VHRRGRIHLAALAAALTLGVGIKQSAHAQGNLQAFPRAGGALFVTWQSAPDPAVVGYNVYRRETSLTADKATLVNPQPVTATSLLDTGANGSGLPLGTPVIYYAKAVYKDAAGAMAEGNKSGQSVVTPQNPITVAAGNLLYWDINTTNPGKATLDGNVLTVRASGPDLWDNTDGQTFVGMPVMGDYQLTAQITEQPVNDPSDDNPNDWSKFGVEIRGGPFRGDPFAILFTSANRDPGVLYEGHTTFAFGNTYSQGGSAQSDTTFPLYLRLVKQGSKITAFQSSNGQDYTQVGDPQDYGVNLGPVTYAGVFSTAARDGQYAIGKFAADSIKIEPK